MSKFHNIDLKVFTNEDLETMQRNIREILHTRKTDEWQIKIEKITPIFADCFIAKEFSLLNSILVESAMEIIRYSATYICRLPKEVCDVLVQYPYGAITMKILGMDCKISSLQCQNLWDFINMSTTCSVHLTAILPRCNTNENAKFYEIMKQNIT